MESRMTIPPRRGQPPEWADANCHDVLEAAPDAMLVVNRAGEVVAANQQAQKLYRYGREHLIGRVVESLIPARLRDRHRQHRENFFANPETRFMQVSDIFAERSDGSEIPVDVSLSRLPIGSETFAITAIRDTTERVRAEELKRLEAVLQQSEERFRMLADSSPVLIWQSGLDKLCTYFNKPWLDFTGRSVEQELGNGWAEGVHPDDLQKCLDTYTQSFDRRDRFRMEYRLRHHDGQYRWIVDIGVPRFNRDGSFAGYVGIGVDINERKLDEDQLRQYERAVEAAGEMIAVVDREYRILLANRKYATMRNMGKDEILGRFVHEVLNKGVFEAVVKPKLDECFQGKVVRYEMKYPYPELGERDVAVSYFPIEGATGVEGAACILQDITEHKQAEEALRQSEERFRLAAQAGNMYAYTWNVANDAIVRSGDVSRVLGPTGEASLTRQQLLTRVHPDDRALFNASVNERTPARPDVQISYRMLRPDGSVVWVEKTAHALFDEGGRMVRVIGMVADVTERKQAEEVLRESEERLRLAVQTAKMYAFEWDVTTDVIMRSSEYVNVLGATEPRTLTHEQVLEKIHPEDRPKVVAAVARHSPENPTVDVTYRVLLPGKSPVWAKSSGRAFFDGEGRMLRVIGMVADVTDHKLAEEALSGMSRKLVEAQEQERSGIARELHDDINQRLAMLAVELEQLKENPSEIESRVEELRKRTTEISNSVQALSHDLHSSQLEYLGAVAGIRSWCREFAERQGMEIDCRHDVRSSLPPEIGLCLFRVLQEALHNAIKHSGVKRIEVQLREESGEIHLTVSDSGRGFDVEAVKQGKGLGLTSMRERVRLVNGTISVESKLLGGTTIHVRVPFKLEQGSQRAAG
jgi:PAS domain S-box-containing protein